MAQVQSVAGSSYGVEGLTMGSWLFSREGGVGRGYSSGLGSRDMGTGCGVDSPSSASTISGPPGDVDRERGVAVSTMVVTGGGWASWARSCTTCVGCIRETLHVGHTRRPLSR